MESRTLYRVQREDLEKVRNLLRACFMEDPLFTSLVQDRTSREYLSAELLECDLTEFFETCEIYAKSSEIESILVVSEEAGYCRAMHNLLVELRAQLRTGGEVTRKDLSLDVFWNFVQGRDYLNARWTDQLHQTRRMHILYLAVNPDRKGQGIAKQLLQEVTEYAQEQGIMLTLETYQTSDVRACEQCGFKIYGIVQKSEFFLKQYCMVREPQNTAGVKQEQEKTGGRNAGADQRDS